MAIADDKEFKAALNALSDGERRIVAALFAESVLAPSADSRVAGAIQAAKNPGAGERELMPAFNAVRAAAVESYTQCGKEADWMCQAGHFVAKAALAGVAPAAGGNPAWEAAMNARMARAAERIASGEGTAGDSEAQRQYRILDEFLQEKSR